MQTKNSRYKRPFIFLAFLVATSSVLITLYSKKIARPNVLSSQETHTTPTPTQFPFEEMTIPYLQSRQYQSKLNEKIQISKNNSYTTYLTSYDSDGFKINALLTVPNTNPPKNGYPAVVFVHGYIPPQTYKTTEKYTSYVDYLAKNGLVVLKIDLRGHGSSEGEAGGSYYSADYIIDTLNAYSALENESNTDKDKISLWGHSMAGNVTFRSFVASPKIHKLVIWAGAGYTYEDLQQYRISDNSYRPPTSQSNTATKRRQLFDKYGNFNPQSDFWKKVVPTNYLDDKQGSVQIHHAIDDTVVSINYSRNLMKILDDTKIDHELFEYKTGGHNISGSSFNSAMKRTADFFSK